MGDQLVAGDALIVLADRPGEPRARGRERLESERREEPGGADVPGVGHHEQPILGVERPEAFAATGDGHG